MPKAGKFLLSNRFRLYTDANPRRSPPPSRMPRSHHQPGEERRKTRLSRPLSPSFPSIVGGPPLPPYLLREFFCLPRMGRGVNPSKKLSPSSECALGKGGPFPPLMSTYLVRVSLAFPIFRSNCFLEEGQSPFLLRDWATRVRESKNLLMSRAFPREEGPI